MMARNACLLAGLLLCGCPDGNPRPPLVNPPGNGVSPFEEVGSRRPEVTLTLPSTGPATGAVVVGDALVVGVGGAFHAVDAASGRIRWSTRLGKGLFRPVVRDSRLFLPRRRRGGGSLVEVDPRTGRVLRRTTIRVPGRDKPGALTVELNTAPAVGGGLVLWPSSRSLFAFSLQDGARRWRHDAEGPTPYRRFHFGSDPPLVGRDTVFWGHQQGVAAVALATGKKRWTWPAYRGFALRPLLGPKNLYVSNDAGIFAFDRRTGKERWKYAPGDLRFQRLAGEEMSGLYRGHLWFVGEPVNFRYRLVTVRTDSGKMVGHRALPGVGLSGSIASDGPRLYARFGRELVAIDLDRVRPLWKMRLADDRGSSPVVAGGRVWVANESGVLEAASAGR